MASSEVDQKALANFAAITSLENPFLSAMLYKILGLSVMLSKKLVRARRLRRLDPTRETKSLQLYYHIIWLSREGLLILEELILPLVEGYVELKILGYKLRASFYHIFVLFHNQPAVHLPGVVGLPSSTSVSNGVPAAESPSKESESRFSFHPNADVITVSGKPGSASGGAPRGKVTQAPPGFAPVQPPPSVSAFILPALDYTPTATACFNHASLLAERFLPGSHPLRLSIKLEFAAYLYDCLHDPHACRRLAKQAIADVYNAQEGMDDESFEDAAEIVGILGKMVKRGAKGSSAAGSTTAVGTPRDEKSRSEGSRTPTRLLNTPPSPRPCQPVRPTRPTARGGDRHYLPRNRRRRSPAQDPEKTEPGAKKSKAPRADHHTTALRPSQVPTPPPPPTNPPHRPANQTQRDRTLHLA
ncbi:14-3-3 protein [Aspergillus heteromorphus CBS 117.55]|uniref:14-3-3 protein n=1 Tax=Aspergillus heteromorphus CBS 117.55 TaxID=1448321 RepID=A0A317WX24_9EURO|nr:14-3-3 protein [Aspergillus heteromorphus CBS 117.55]PWY89747.1 14-3-3 protein [Aspergillus heteromorphus CBS 117.55]